MVSAVEQPVAPLRNEFPEKLRFLFEPHRYKVLHGGRGGAKSWGIARALLIIGVNRPIRVLCAREIQNSINESVHQLLSQQIVALGLQDSYKVKEKEIIGPNGTLFFFSGLRYQIENLKSAEGIDIVWVEEARTVSRNSWDKLIPTIRKDGSEIWVSFNPELETDETYRRFVVKPPKSAVVHRLTWKDNPWFPQVLKQEMLDLRESDYDEYLFVWDGRCRQALQGSIYAKELRAATEEGRVRRVPYDLAKPVHTFWDLGHADNTSIWFVQIIGFEYRVLDFYQNSLQALPHYLKVLQEKPYIYGTDWLPHDGTAKTLGTGKSIEEMMRAANRKVRIVPKLSINDGINAARTVFPNCWFDEDKCADGLNFLRRYRYDVDPDTKQFSRAPMHDENSHAADAFRYFGVAIKEDKPKTAATTVKHRELRRPAQRAGLGWMG